MEMVRLAREAMATRFELVLQGANAARLRAAGEAALAEIELLESRWSLYRPASEIARVNALAAREAVRLSRPTFRLLQMACRIHDETEGAFDIAIGPVAECWGFMGRMGGIPERGALEEARRKAGTRHIILDEKESTARFDIEGAMIDLGAVGKGAAVDAAVAILREAGVENALVHGGTSSVFGLGAPPGEEGWKIAVAAPPGQPPIGAGVVLRNEALSVSAVWGKYFEAEGKKLGHVIDPRTGAPVDNAQLAAVVSPTAAEGDAFSTALLVLGFAGRAVIARARPHFRTLVMAGHVESAGFLELIP